MTGSITGKYVQENAVVNENIRQYKKTVVRKQGCACTDGCQNSRRCACYKSNVKLQNPTYTPQYLRETDETIMFQMRATSQINKVFNFNECHPGCGCDKDVCFNFLLGRSNLKKFKFLIKRVRKTHSVITEVNENKSTEDRSEAKPTGFSMWGLFALEDIPAGAFLTEYRGEVVTKKQGDMRGKFYDRNGLSYLFDMNDPLDSDEKEKLIQKAYLNEFFPLCLDAMFFGNEARFINHSCDPNVQSFNLTGENESNTLHSIGLFATRNIRKGEELNLDYQWDKNELSITSNIPCLCGSHKCRGYLMRAKKPKQNHAVSQPANSHSLEGGRKETA